MRDAPLLPGLHFFVCANRRPHDSPVGPGCASRGEEVFDTLKDEVAKRHLFADLWVTKTHCLGICPREGATIAIYPVGRIVTEVTRDDALALLTTHLGAAR
jgi:(2Fe-2S) ferredoxin